MHSFSLQKMLVMDWSGVDYLWIIVMFLSAVWTLILTAPIHCRRSIGEQVMDAKFLQICSYEQTNSILDGLRMSTFSANFHFWVNYSMKAFLFFVCLSHCCQMLWIRIFLKTNLRVLMQSKLLKMVSVIWLDSKELLCCESRSHREERMFLISVMASLHIWIDWQIANYYFCCHGVCVNIYQNCNFQCWQTENRIQLLCFIYFSFLWAVVWFCTICFIL